MENIGNGLYRIDYYSSEYGIVLKVLDLEQTRISKLGHKIISHTISVDDINNIIVFYLHLYFKSTSSEELTYKDLFG
jgi:hypothetical protein